MNGVVEQQKPALPCGIIVMRHGRREDSENPLWQTQARFPFDTPLCASEREILEAVKQLQQAGRTIDVVYTSPFLRCLETSERVLRALACGSIPVLVHRGLSEVHNPHLLFKTGRPSFSQRARYWLWRATYQRNSRPARQRFSPKACILDSSWPQLPESELAATMRFRQVMLELAMRHPGKQVLIVSHGKSVQVAHEALGCSERVQQVGFAGFVACRPKSELQQQQAGGEPDGGKDAARGAADVQWTDFGLDPQVPFYNLDMYT